MIKDDINRIIQQAGENTGMMIYESSVLLKGQDTKISVKIDKYGIISHEDCEVYSRELSSKLDESELVPNYSLEVSSPGLNRKIRSFEEFRRFVNAPVKIIIEKEEKREVIKGTLVAIENEFLRLMSEGKEITVEYKKIVSANLDY